MSVMAGEGPVTSRPSGWMVSPAWDLGFIVASPVAIVPALWLLVNSTITPEQLAIPVFAFATLGHHLPGYMRAYGDRDLFRRFRLRFVVVPPLLFGAVLFLVQPSFFGVALAPPSSLQLLLVVWGAWHGLMQIYGFMRIYDAKEGGVQHGRSQRLDLAVCFAIFVAGFLYSDARMFALMDLVMSAGLPGFGRDLLEGTRMAAGVAIGGLTVAYLWNCAAQQRIGRVAWRLKLALAVSTAGIYTFSGLVTTNILLGGAVFEVFHAVQYVAIVWYFNRRLEARAGAGFGPLRFLFQDRWTSLALYLFSVVAFGALFLLMGTPQYGPIRAGTGATNTAYLVFSAFFVTSSLLHYYYDGFIWKLHDRNTGGTLGFSGGLSDVSVPALLHFGKWGLLALAVAAVIGLETTTPTTRDRQELHLVTLASLTPEVPELRRQLVYRSLAEQHVDDALAMAEENIVLRPRSHDMHADLGRVHLARQDLPAAEAAYRDALALRPAESIYRVDLARVIARQGAERFEEASALFREAIAARPDDTGLAVELALVELRLGHPAEAVALLEPSLERDPRASETRALLIEGLIAEGATQRALEIAREGVSHDSTSALAQRSLADVLAASNRWSAAAEAYSRAFDLDPSLAGIEHDLGQAWFRAGRYHPAAKHLLAASQAERASADTHFMLGVALLETDRAPFARLAFQHFVARAPDPATGYRTLGNRLAKRGYADAAAEAWREAVRLDPDDAATRAKLLQSEAAPHPLAGLLSEE